MSAVQSCILAPRTAGGVRTHSLAARQDGCHVHSTLRPSQRVVCTVGKDGRMGTSYDSHFLQRPHSTDGIGHGLHPNIVSGLPVSAVLLPSAAAPSSRQSLGDEPGP